MAVPRFKDMRVGPRDRRRAQAAGPDANRGRSPGRRLDDGPAELNEQVPGPGGLRADPRADAPFGSRPDTAAAPLAGGPGPAVNVATEDIPLLTEVVQIADGEPKASTESFAIQDADLRQRITDEVLQRLSRRAGDLLDAQLPDLMAPVLERLAATIAQELQEKMRVQLQEQMRVQMKEPLERMIRDVVARAVAEEVTPSAAEGADVVDRYRTGRRTR
jgi:hypothetical protein